jgi:probable HAF family extracellular repeat protein
MKGNLSVSMVAIALVAALAGPVQLSAQQHHHYKLIDIVTFGGSLSSINFAVDVNGRAVNLQGVTVGFSATATPKLPTSQPIICGGDDGFGSTITHAFRWQNGTVKDLGALPPVETNCSNAYQVNPSGEIAGFSENGEFDPVTGTNQSRAVHWKNGMIEELGSFGGNQNEALAINNRGQIVGFSLNTVPDPFSIFDIILNVILGSSGGTQTRAVLWQNGQMQDLGTLGGNDAAAFYINDRSQVAGHSYTSTIPNPVTGVPPQDPFLWENGTMVDLGTLGGAYGIVSAGQGSGLNNLGQVIGASSVAANPGACFFTEFDPNCHPFLWDRGKLIDLNTSTAGGNPVGADGINDAGEIVGAADFSSVGGSSFDAYLWRKGVATDLGTVAGDCFSRALAINASGQIVGNSFSPACDFSFSHAFLWENGSIIDLNELIPAGSPLQLVAANDINDRAEIAGEGVPPGVDPSNVFTQGHAFLLIPCDENHPNIEGCDYSLVAASVAVLQSGHVVRGATSVPPASLLRRLTRYRLPGRGFGPRN